MSTAAPPVAARPDRALGASRAARLPVRLGRWGRLAAVALAGLVAAYFGICFKYADALTLVHRQALARPAAYVAALHEDVSFTTADGLTLRGWWFEALQPRDRAVVLVHGKDQDRIDSSFGAGRIARFLLADGYSALLFDLRGHGTSDGLRWGLGGGEAQDVAAAVDFAATKAGVPRSRVAVVAESMGAGSAAMALTRIPDVGPMVLDSVYADVSRLLDEIGPQESGLPAAFTPGMALMARVFFGIDLTAVRPLDQVRAHPERAFLFIACDRDATVAVRHAYDMKAASANPGTELWVATDCGHVKAFATYPAEWEARVTAFLDEQLGK